MGLYSNSPTLSYIQATGITVVWNKELYTVADFYTNKKYVYWNANNPNKFSASNVMPDRSTVQCLVLINDNGTITEVPNEHIEVNYDGNSAKNITDRIFGIYDKNEEFGDRFVVIEQDIEGLKQIVGEGGGGDDGEGHYEIWQKISSIEQKADEIDLSVKEVTKTYNDDKELNQLREDLNGSIIKLNSDLGTFKSEINTYFKDNQISDEELTQIEVQKTIIVGSKTALMTYVDKVILIAENQGHTQDILALNNAKIALDTAHNNLITNINNAIADKIITPSDITIVTDAFAKYSLRINELKSICDNVIFLGIGGVIAEELANINIKSDEIKLSVSKTEEDLKSDLNLQKVELEKQIKDVETSLNDFENVVNTTFKDGIIDAAEKEILLDRVSTLEKEKSDVDSRYTSLYSDSYLKDPAKSSLKTNYDNYVVAHNNLKSKLEDVISDGVVSELEKAQINTLMSEYSSKLAGVHVSMNKAIDDIALNKAKSEVQAAKDALQDEIDEVQSSVGDLDKYMNTIFKDGIISHNERRLLEEKIVDIEKEKLDIDEKYKDLYNNPDLI